MGLGKTYSTKYLLDSNNNSGVAGQVLSTTSTGIDWVDANTVPGAGLWLENGNDIYNSNSGNVGIGVTSPSTKLEVLASQSNSSIRAGGLEMQSYAVNNSWYAENLYYNAGWKLRSNGYATQMYMQGGKITFNRFVSGNAGDFVTPYPTMILDSNGNVGIGTTSPTGKFNSYISATRQLTHNGNGGDLSIISDNNSSPVMFIKGTGSADLLNVFDNTTEVFTILDGGNVGIGTTSPAQPLSVHGNFLVRTTNADGNKNRMQCIVGGSSDAANLYLYYGNSGDGTVSVRINAQGNSYFNGGQRRDRANRSRTKTCNRKLRFSCRWNDEINCFRRTTNSWNN